MSRTVQRTRGKRPSPRKLFKRGAANPGHRSQRGITGAGRKKGTPNKVTATIRDAVTGALQELGGQSYLVKVGQRDMRAFTGLLGKAMPLQIEGGDGAGVKSFKMHVSFRDPDDKGKTK